MDYSRKVYNIEDLTFEGLLKTTNEEYMYSIYLGYYPETKKMYKSPFNNERTPSFNFYYRDNKLRYKDYSSGKTGTVVDLVMELYSLNFKEALIRLNNDILPNNNIILNTTSSFCNDRNNRIIKNIKVVLKSYTQEDIDYWEQYYFDINDLEYFNIKPCQEVWLDGKIWYTYNSKNPCYRYIFNGKYKIYKPLDTTGWKWLNNCNNLENIQGLEYLDYTTDTLIITKSYKDVACIKKHLNYDSISFHGESHYIEQKVINYFKRKYKNIYFLYDNDIPGIKSAKKLSELYNIPYIYIPNSYNVKDISDYISTYGIHNTKQIVKFLINQ